MSNAQELKTKLRKLEEIPTLPGFFAKIMETLESDRASVKDLAVIIGEDPALTSKIFRLSNSAYYGRFKKVATIEQAVSTVGFNEIKTISLSIGVFSSFSEKLSLSTLQGFWIHALTTATAIRAIGDKGQESSLEKIYFGGLLHDIGKLVMTLLIGDDYLIALDQGADDDRVLLRAEKDHFGVHHAQVGKWLGERWHFPNELNEFIQYHHHPDRGTLLRPRSVATIFISDHVAHNVGMTEFNREEQDPRLVHALELLEISDDGLVEVCDKVRDQEQRIAETFSLIS
jgi:HD-like signal output (HDOD) protein